MPVNIVGNIGRGPGVIMLQEPVDLRDDGELLVYGWILSQYQVITNRTGGFLTAVDFVVPLRSMQPTPLLRVVRLLPRFIARHILRARYRIYRTYMTMTEEY
ncbi:hypothetical protein VTO73DRAFT_11652 [Trametes versicolor]